MLRCTWCSRIACVVLTTALAAIAAGCSEQDGSSPQSDGGEPDGAIPPGCLEIEIWDGGGVESPPRYDRRTWDATTRVLTAESSSSSTFGQVSTLKWKYAGEGRPIAYIGVEQPFQQDFRYDPQDNLIDFVLSYPDVADVNMPSRAPPYMGTSFANEYDAAGRLTASTATSYGSGYAGTPSVRRDYGEDDAGNCVTIDTTISGNTAKELRTYTGGKLTHVETSAGATTDIVYDDQGRLVSSTYTAKSYFGGGKATRSESHEYLADGSERVNYQDGFTDIVSERHSVTTRTAECLAIDAAVGKPKDNRCRVR